MKKIAKNKMLIVAAFVVVISIALVVVRNSFSLETNHLTLNCNNYNPNVGSTVTCTLQGKISSGKVSSIAGNISVGGNLQLSGVTPQGVWQGKANITNIQYYTDMSNYRSGTFDILKINVKALSAGTGTISFNNMKFYSENYDEIDAGNINTTITIKTPTPTPTPTPTTTSPTKTPTPTKSSNNYLSSLSLSKGKISFSKTKTSYSVTVGSDVSSVKVSAKLAHSKASFLAGYNPRTVNLGYGKNTVKIIVVAENGARRTYTIYITRSKGSSKAASKSGSNKSSSKSSKSSSSKSSNNKLKTLYLSDGIINFKSNKYAYDVEVNNGVDVITVEGETDNSKAKVKGLGKHDLKEGANTIKVVVTAENGDEKTYTLRITRKSKDSSEDLDSNNYLKDLSVEGYEFDFSKNKEDYDINRDGRESLKIKAVTESKNAKVTIQGNERLADGDEIQIIVTAEDGSNRTYTITVHDSNNIMYTAIGIFIIGLLSVIVVIAYKNKKANEE